MKHYFTYITKEADYDLIKSVLSKAFEVEFTEHESGWWGEYALAKNANEFPIKVYPNFVHGEGYHEEQKKDYPYLVEIPGSDEPETIKSIVSTLSIRFELARQKEI